MKTIKITHYITTGIVGLMMAFSVYAYLVQPAMQQAFQHLGYPDYFRIQLAIAKLLGIIVLVAPFPLRIKEWAYAGFAISFISAFIAHVSSGDPLSAAIMPLVFLGLLIASYVTYRKWILIKKP